MKIIRHRTLLILSAFLILSLFSVATSVLAQSGPVFSINATTATFNNQTVGTSSGATSLFIKNTGGSDLVLSSITLAGANPSDFTFELQPLQVRLARIARGAVASSAFNLPYTLHAGASAALLVAFSPTASGARSATLNIAHNASGSPQVITLSGTTISAGINVSPTAIDFGSILVGNTSTVNQVTVTNNGSGTLVISNVGLSGANNSDFNVTMSAPAQTGRRPSRLMNVAVPPASSATLNVAFSPTASGARSASLNITDNAGGSPQAVTLSGNATVSPLSLSDVTLGANLEKLVTVSINPPPASELPVTITSSDPSKVLLSTDTTGTTAGSVSITPSIHAGADSIFPGFYVQALGSTGTATLTVTATGYPTITANVTIGKSGFVLVGPDGTGSDFSTIAGTPDSALTVAVKNLDNSNNPYDTNPAARISGGLTVNVPVNSATPAAGTVVNSPAQFTGASSNGSSITFHPIAQGTTLLSLGTPSLAGFTVPAMGTSLTATVQPPIIQINPATIGANLEVTGTARLSTPAPTGGVVVTITSSDPNSVLLSTDTTSLGSESIMLTVPEGTGATSGFPPFVIQGLTSSGIVQLTATATGYQNGTANVALTPSAFLINGGKGIGNDFTTTPAPLSADTPLTITPYRLDPQFNPAVSGTVRGGIFVAVPVASANTNVGTLNSPSAVFVGGDSTNSDMGFHPVANGTTALTVQQPDGSSTPTSGGTLNAVVNAPALSLNFSQNKIGRNLQVTGFGALNAPAPTGGIQVTVSSNNAQVLVSSSPTTAGSSSITLTVPAGQGKDGALFPAFYVQSTTATGNATITIKDNSNTFAQATANVSMTPGGFILASPNGIGDDFATLHGGNPATVTVLAYQLNASTFAPEAAESVRGGLSPNVTVSLGNANAGTITPTPLPFPGGSNSANVLFTPGANPATSTVNAVAPSGFTTPSADATINVNVN